MWLTACFLLSRKIVGLHSKSCKVHLTTQLTINSFSLSLASHPFAAVGKELPMSFAFLSYPGVDPLVSWNFLYARLFSSPLQIEMGIVKPRDKRYLVEICKSTLFLVNEKGGSQSLTKLSHRMFKVTHKQLYLVSLSRCLLFAFGMLRILSSSLWEKKKGTEESLHPAQEKRLRDIMGYFEQIPLKLLSAE